MEGAITLEDLLAAGLTLEFISAFNKMFEEFAASEEGEPDLRGFVEEGNLSDAQRRLVSRYVRQILSQVGIGLSR